MSLFHVEEWFSTLVPDAWSLAVDQLIPNEPRQQLVVGNLDGLLAVYDPGRVVENREQMASLAQIRLKESIIQLNCTLFIFDAENQALSRQLTNALHPGPIEYSPASESLLTTCGGFLSALRYKVLIQHTSSSKKINWKYIYLLVRLVGELGRHRTSTRCNWHRFDSAIDSRTLQKIVVMLHERWPRFCYPTVRGFVHKNTRFLQRNDFDLDGEKIHLEFSESLRSMLALLGDDGHLQVAYLGTEPALFKSLTGATQTRFIDFEQRRAELKEFEAVIWSHSRENPVNRGSGIDFSVDVSVGMNSSNSGAPNEAVATVTASGTLSNTLNLVLQWPKGVEASKDYLNIAPGEAGRPFQIAICCTGPVFDHRCQAASVCGSELQRIEFSLPLQLLCREVQSQRNATFKLTIDSSHEVLDLAVLFPEFRPDSQSALGLQPFLADANAAVSIFVAPKTNRYRIQSDKPDFCFVVFKELTARIHQHQSDAEIRCSTVPIAQMLTDIAEFLETENMCESLEKEANRVSVQMRNVETVFLNKLKVMSEEETPTHINVLMNYTYRELNSLLDRLQETRVHLDTKKRPALRALIGVTVASMKLAGVELPFDERHLDGEEQTFGERLSQVLSETSGSAITNIAGIAQSPVELCRAIANICDNSSVSLSQIAEVAEEDEEREKERKYEQEREKAISDVDKGVEFISGLESGSIPIDTRILGDN